MQVKIWQQFSSNHSGSFTVIGVFESPQKAEAVAAELKAIFQNLFQWYQDHPDESNLNMDDPPPPPERELIEKYNLVTETNLGLEGDDVRASLSTTALDRFVLLHIGETWWNDAHSQLAALVGNMGTVTKGISWEVDGSPIIGLEVSLSAVAPDEDTAQAIFDETRAALDDANRDYPVLELDLPWCEELEHLVIEKDGHKLTIALRSVYLHENLTGLIRYLQGQGFTDFDAQLTEITET